MTTTPWPLAELEIIGGHCCPRPPAPFGRGPAVVRRRDDPDRICIAFKLDTRGASGDVLTNTQWRGLVGSFNALELPAPIPAHAFAALWVFTASFGSSYEDCLKDLRTSNALLFDPQYPTERPVRLAHEVQGAQPSLALVDESRARHLRSEWRTHAYDEAWKSLKSGKPAEGEHHAERALSLLSTPVPEDFALLSIIYSRNNRLARSDGLIALAANSYPSEFNQKLETARKRILEDLHTVQATPSTDESEGGRITRSSPRRLTLLQNSQGGKPT